MADVLDASMDVPEDPDAGPGTDSVAPEDVTGDSGVGDSTDGPDVGPDAGSAGHCGDGKVEGVERCDGKALGGASCASLGFASGGDLTCTGFCFFGYGSCKGPWTCPADPSEPDNGWAQAVPLAPGVVDGALCPGGSGADEDWYAIATPPEGYDAAAIFFDPAQGVIEAEIHGRFRGPELPPEFYTRVLSIPDTSGFITAGRLAWAWDGRTTRPDTLYLRLRSVQTDVPIAYRIVYLPSIACFPQSQIPELACATGTLCKHADLAFTCEPGCAFDHDCPEGQRCTGGQCGEPECTGHGDCAVGQACTAGYACIDAPCKADKDCAQFQAWGPLVCDAGAQRCVQCRTTEDCPYPAESECAGSRCHLLCTEDAFAPNPTLVDAADVPLVDGVFEASDLTLCGAWTEDWYRIEVTEAGTVQIDVIGAAHAQMTLSLVEATDLMSANGQIRSRLDRAVALFDVEAGTYLLGLRNTMPGEAPKAVLSYGLRISTLPPECRKSYECPVGLGCGLFSCEETTCSLDAQCDPYGLVCDEAGGFCAPCGEDADCNSLEACQDNACVPACTDDAYEPNGTKETAQALAAGVHDLELCKARGETEEDWFRVDLDAGQRIAVYLVPNYDFSKDFFPTEWPGLVLLDADGMEVPVVGDGTGALVLTTGKTGPAYIRVHAAPPVYAAPWGPIAYRLYVGVDTECAGTPWTSDCPSGSVCEDFACRPGCQSELTCAPGELCMGFTCTVPACVRHAECPAGEACTRSSCEPTPTCDEDWDCQHDAFAETFGLLYCDPATGRCVECLQDGACFLAPFEGCVNGACVTQCDDDDREPDDRQSEAVPASLGTLSNLSLCARPTHWSEPYNWPGEQDWSVVELEPGRTLVARIDNWDLRPAIVNAEGKEVGTETPWSPDGRGVAWTVDEGGRAWVRIASASSPVWGSTQYTLKLSEGGCAVDADCKAGAYCRDLECKATVCQDDDACILEGTGTRCDVANGWCIDCLTNTDCGPAGFQCQASHCTYHCGEDPFAPNDTEEKAAPIAVPLDILGLTLCSSGAYDWYAPGLEAGKKYLFRVEPVVGSGPVLEMTLYRRNVADGSLVFEKFGQASPEGATFDFDAVASDGGWRLQVHAIGPQLMVTYRLLISVINPS